MIELPEGKMKSREGKVVDADDLIDEMIQTAREMAIEKGKMKEIEESEFNDNIKKIAMGALKYHIIKVEPRKNIMFNPEDQSILMEIQVLLFNTLVQE
jgi:arginyl-tRNA synthetase